MSTEEHRNIFFFFHQVFLPLSVACSPRVRCTKEEQRQDFEQSEATPVHHILFGAQDDMQTATYVTVMAMGTLPEQKNHRCR